MKTLISKHFKLLLVIAILLNILYIFIFQPACPWKKNFNIEDALFEIIKIHNNKKT